MTRTRGLRFAATFVAALSLTTMGVSSNDPASAVSTRPPNVLIVLTDDQRGGMRFLPEVRQFFGREGTKYSNGFANTPLCCPARATLMTGQYPHNHGVWTNRDWEKLNQDDTLQADLRAAGYKTAMFGKYLNHFPVRDQAPPGFDRFAVFHTGGEGTGYYSGGTWNINGRIKTVDRYTSHVLQNKSARFIRANTDEPWLLMLSVPAPHSPFIAEPRYESAPVGRWRGNPAVHESDRSDKPPWMSNFNGRLRQGTWLRRVQMRTLMSVNDMVGEVATALRETGQDRDTLAFFTTDNGYLWGEHGMLGKPSAYMPSIQVPFYARWPGRLGSGEVAPQLVSHIDMTATAYEAAGVTPEHELDGYSLLGPHRRERLLTEMMVPARGKLIPAWSAFVTASGDHYIEYRDGEAVVFQELYELDTDPWELRNVAPVRPEKVGSLSPLLQTERHCSGTTCP